MCGFCLVETMVQFFPRVCREGLGFFIHTINGRISAPTNSGMCIYWLSRGGACTLQRQEAQETPHKVYRTVKLKFRASRHWWVGAGICRRANPPCPDRDRWWGLLWAPPYWWRLSVYTTEVYAWLMWKLRRCIKHSNLKLCRWNGAQWVKYLRVKLRTKADSADPT